MFCPECKSEYRPGFHTCADCKVPLVEELPQPPPPPKDYADARPEQARWELNRTDSRNIAFVKGALIGFAVGQAIQIPTSLLLSRIFIPTGLLLGPAPEWLSMVFAGPGMIPPLGILIGGFWARSRLR